MSGPLPIYQSHLGAVFGLLPPEVRRFHSLQGNIRLDGTVAIKGASTFLGRIAAFAVRLPAESNRQAFVFDMRADARQEIWTRRFVSRTMRSKLSLRGPHLIDVGCTDWDDTTYVTYNATKAKAWGTSSSRK
jgi:hypothetical protein